MTKVLLAILLVLVMMGISMENKAEASEQTYSPYDVVCATLAFNAGYDAEGELFAARVEPYFIANERAIRYISGQVVQDLAEQAMMDDRTLPYVARKAFNYYCVGDQDA